MLKEVIMTLNAQNKEILNPGFETGLFESISEACHQMTKQRKNGQDQIIISKQEVKTSLD